MSKISAQYTGPKSAGVKVEIAEETQAEFGLANGKDGTVLSHQGKFPVTTQCVRCGAKARVALGLRETLSEGDDKFGDPPIHTLHPSTSKGFWPQGVVAFCLYFCTDPSCATVTTLWNQT
jgi:hypothetical protein